MKKLGWPLVLVVWTIGIWGSRLRNALADNELVGAERVLDVGIAAIFVGLAVIVGLTRWKQHRFARPALEVLAALGVIRFSIRGPLILASSEWDVGFKVVHTILWIVTVVLSILAWRRDPLRQRTGS